MRARSSRARRVVGTSYNDQIPSWRSERRCVRVLVARPSTYPSRVRDHELRYRRNRHVNSEGSVNQRFGEFWTEIPGRGRNPGGSFRTPIRLSRNGERRPASDIAANDGSKRPITRNARQPISRRRALTGVAVLSAETGIAPRAEPSTEGFSVFTRTNN